MQTITEYSHDAGFPTFAPLFERSEDVPVPLYLTLLNLSVPNDSQIAVRVVKRRVADSPDVTGEIVALFAESNWRPHLVGAAAMMTGVANDEIHRALWQAFDGGSWVSPQLAATAFMCDRDFENQARRRIESGCPINTERLAGLDWVTRHSAAGPISFATHSSKALASLVAICRDIPSTALWLARALAQADISKALEDDIDGGDRIAIDWLSRIEKVFKHNAPVR